MFFFSISLDRSSTFRNVFLRTIRRLIRESVRNMPLPSKSAAHDALDKPDLVGEGQMEVLAQMQQKQPVGEVIQKVDQMSLIQLLEKQLQLRYFNASTLTRHLEETNGFDDEDKSCASEK